jgi:unsaturated chondroitin disaccharide hydrolase
VYKFDSAMGAPIAGDTYQGLNASSAWSRGQGWALAGFAILAEMTGTQEYLAAAERVASYIEKHLPEDRIPRWDYWASVASVKDSSAGAITAYGLLRLWKLTSRTRHLDLAETMLNALVAHCLASPGSAPILEHATADLPHGLGIDESTIYGDYYFLKSLLVLRGLESRRESGEGGARNSCLPLSNG